MSNPRFDVVKDYLEGNAVCVAKVCVSQSHQFDFVIFRDPSRFIEADSRGTNLDLDASDGGWRKYGVLFSVANCVKVPEGWVPSLVRLKRPQDGLDLERSFLAPTFDGRLNIIGSLPEREFGVLSWDGSAGDCGGENSLIQYRP